MKYIFFLISIFLLTSGCGLDQGNSRSFVISQSDVEETEQVIEK